MSHCGDNTGESTTQVQRLYRQGTLQPDVHRCQAQVPWGQTSCPRGLSDCVIAQLHSEAEQTRSLERGETEGLRGAEE